MRRFFTIVSVLLCINSLGQSHDIRFVIKDKNGSEIDYLYLVIDDSIYVVPDFDNNLITNLSSGSYNIKSDLYGHTVIDTSIRITKKDSSILLRADLVKDAFMQEFNSAKFQKIYTNSDYLPIIGLRADNTFLMKSFFHVSIVGCYQIEKGEYFIQNDTLILKVNKYDCPCFRTNDKIEHTYRFPIKNDDIRYLDKYSGFIEKKYTGHGQKEFDE